MPLKFLCTLKKILIFQYCDSNIRLFSIPLHLVITRPTIKNPNRYQKHLISLLYFLYRFCRLVHAFLYYFPYSCRSFTLLKALAKSNRIFPLSLFRARKSNIYHYRDSWKCGNFRESNQEKKQRNFAKNQANKIKIDNFARNNRENFTIRWYHNYFAFWEHL